MINLPLLGSIFILIIIFLSFGLGNGAVFQLVPNRWPASTGIMSGIIGAAGGIGGFYIPVILGSIKQSTDSYSIGFFIFGIASSLALIMLNIVHKEWMEWSYLRYDTQKKALVGLSSSGKVIMEFLGEVEL